MKNLFSLALFLLVLIAQHAHADKRSAALRAQAEGLVESIFTVGLGNGVEQVGVYSRVLESTNPKYLAVMIPGWPCVIRPKVSDGMISEIRIPGNFLIRSRRFLVDRDIATLLVDCRSDSGDECSPIYQSSPERDNDLRKLILKVKETNPTIQKVWLIGTSGGTVTSSYVSARATDFYTGFIHTATIVRPVNDFWSAMRSFNYGKAVLPQLFIHHKRDPGLQTPYELVQDMTSKFEIPLVTVEGASAARGVIDEHSFVGRERQVMREISRAIKSERLLTKSIE